MRGTSANLVRGLVYWLGIARSLLFGYHYCARGGGGVV